jgi:hypothetical protein
VLALESIAVPKEKIQATPPAQPSLPGKLCSEKH